MSWLVNAFWTCTQRRWIPPTQAPTHPFPLTLFTLLITAPALINGDDVVQVVNVTTAPHSSAHHHASPWWKNLIGQDCCLLSLLCSPVPVAMMLFANFLPLESP